MTNLDATDIRADGSRVAVPTPVPSTQRPVDCFYVYPTIDMSPIAGNHTDFSDTDRMAEVAEAQVGQFRGVCNLYVPLYRQVTIGTYVHAPEVQEQYLSVAEADVADAFRFYLDHDNQGRKVVLIGHSQGAEMVTRILKRFFDQDPAMRSRLLLALPIGGHIEVPRGQVVGGTFAHLPLCTGADEMGCVIGYRSIVAGQDGSKREAVPAGHVSACVNPTAIGGPAHPTARSYFLLTERLRRYLPHADSITTPFVVLRDYYNASCVEGPPGIFSLAMSVVALPGDTRENPIDFDSRLFHGELGLHLVDFQLAQGDLIDAVAHRAALATARGSGPSETEK